MSDTTNDMSKINQYFDLLEKRLIYPIEDMNIVESCTATLLLLFAAIDSLSKISCCCSDYQLYKEKKGWRNRFKGFLKLMGSNYETYAKCLCDLRNDLVHTGMNVKILMSKNPGTKGDHLQKKKGYLYLNTRQFMEDFNAKKEEIKKSIISKDEYYNNATARLSDINLVHYEDDEVYPTPSPDEEPFNKS